MTGHQKSLHPLKSHKRHIAGIITIYPNGCAAKRGPQPQLGLDTYQAHAVRLRCLLQYSTLLRQQQQP